MTIILSHTITLTTTSWKIISVPDTGTISVATPIIKLVFGSFQKTLTAANSHMTSPNNPGMEAHKYRPSHMTRVGSHYDDHQTITNTITGEEKRETNSIHTFNKLAQRNAAATNQRSTRGFNWTQLFAVQVRVSITTSLESHTVRLAALHIMWE